MRIIYLFLIVSRQLFGFYTKNRVRNYDGGWILPADIFKIFCSALFGKIAASQYFVIRP